MSLPAYAQGTYQIIGAESEFALSSAEGHAEKSCFGLLKTSANFARPKGAPCMAHSKGVPSEQIHASKSLQRAAFRENDPVVATFRENDIRSSLHRVRGLLSELHSTPSPLYPRPRKHDPRELHGRRRPRRKKIPPLSPRGGGGGDPSPEAEHPADLRRQPAANPRAEDAAIGEQGRRAVRIPPAGARVGGGGGFPGAGRGVP